MITYAANITQLFKELPLAERFKRVADAGFIAYEILFPQRENRDEFLALHRRYGLQIALFDLDVDEKHPRGHLLAEDETLFFARLDQALKLARELKCRRLNALVGLARPELSQQAQIDLIAGRLRRAADLVAADGITLVVEALNAHDAPGYFLNTSRVGFQIVEAVGRPNALFQYDVYHMQISEGNLIETMRQHIGAIGHVQVADVPGRHEPGTGEINYPNVLRALEAAGYDGYVGLEYSASSSQADPFAWLRSRGLLPS